MRNESTPCQVPSVNQSNTRGEVTSVLVLHAGALGDFVLTLNLIARLRTFDLSLQVDVVARCGLARWLAGRGVFDQALDYEGFGLAALFSPQSPVASPPFARLREYNLVLSFFGGEDSQAAAGLRRAGACRQMCIDPAPKPETLLQGRHISEQWLMDLSAAGLDLSATAPAQLRFGDDEKRQARASLAQIRGVRDGRLIIVHPGSGGRSKCFPLEQFEHLVGEFRARGHGVVWMVGPTELDWHGPEWIDGLRSVAPVLFEEHADRAAAWLLGADLYVGNDAGMTHVAAALGVATVALFGPTDPRVWRPLGKKVHVIGFDAARILDLVVNQLPAISNCQASFIEDQRV